MSAPFALDFIGYMFNVGCMLYAFIIASQFDLYIRFLTQNNLQNSIVFPNSYAYLHNKLYKIFT